MQPELDAREAARRARKKVAPAYSCEELESVYVYQVVAGLDTVKRTREQLTSHVGAEARRQLGFDRPRQTKGQVTRLHEVPSEATLSLYRLSFAPAAAGQVDAATPDSLAAGQAPTVYDFKKAEVERQKAALKVRADLYEHFFAELVADYAQTSEGQAATRALFLDGTALLSVFNCLIAKDGEPENERPRRLTRCRVKPVLDKPKGEGGRVVWDGVLSVEQWLALQDQDPSFRRYWTYSADGVTGAGDSRSRSGRGYSIVNIVDADGLPLDFRLGPMKEDGRDRAVELLDDLRPRLDAFALPGTEARVLIADSGFTGYRVAKRVRELGMVESIHITSGGSSDRARTQDEKQKQRVLPIEYTDRKTRRKNRNWYTNGHRELFCRCGAGDIQKRMRREQGGEQVVGLEGRCQTCGPISITSGHWKLNDKRWRRVIGSNDKDLPDLSMGNPLTFSNPIAKAYGFRRFAIQGGRAFDPDDAFRADPRRPAGQVRRRGAAENGNDLLPDASARR